MNQPASDPTDELFEHYHFVIDANQEPLRLDKYLMNRIPNVTRNKVQDAIKDGYVTVNQQTVKSNYKVKPSDDVVIALPEPPRDTEVVPEDIPLNIVYEDDDLLVVYKEAGMVVAPGLSKLVGHTGERAHLSLSATAHHAWQRRPPGFGTPHRQRYFWPAGGG